MKTSTFRYFGLAVDGYIDGKFYFSCEVEIDSFYDDDNNGAGYYNRSADLCSRTWVSFTATWTVTVAVRNSTSFWTGPVLTLYGLNILMEQ